MNKQMHMATTRAYVCLSALDVQAAPDVADALDAVVVRVVVRDVPVVRDALAVRDVPVVLDVVAVLADAEAVVAALVDFLIHYQSFTLCPAGSSCRVLSYGQTYEAVGST